MILLEVSMPATGEVISLNNILMNYTSLTEFGRTDQEMNTVDAILCTHATSMCELFMPFNKSLIAIASTR